MSGEARKILSVDKAIMLLECLNNTGRPMSLGEISNIMGLPKSSIHGTLNTMRARNMIEQSKKDGKYWLGSLIVDLAQASAAYSEKDGEHN